MKFSELFTLCLTLTVTVTVMPTEAAKKKKPRAAKIRGDAVAADEFSGGADGVEGWVVRKDKDGRLIKIPKKQTFRFGGSNVEGAVTRPAESSLSQRNQPSNTSLIPVRRGFRREFLDSAGATNER